MKLQVRDTVEFTFVGVKFFPILSKRPKPWTVIKIRDHTTTSVDCNQILVQDAQGDCFGLWFVSDYFIKV